MSRTKAGRALLNDILELAAAFHQVGSIRDHADPNDRTGWNVRGIETCEDVLCVDALASDALVAAIEAEAREQERERIAATVMALIESRGGLCRRVGDVCGTHGEMWFTTGCEDEPRDLAAVLRAITERSTPDD